MNETATTTAITGTAAPKRTVNDIEKELQEIEIRAEQLRQEKIRLRSEPIVERLSAELKSSINDYNYLGELNSSEIDKLSERLPSIIRKAVEEIHGSTVKDNERRKANRAKKKAAAAAVAEKAAELSETLNATGNE